MCISSSFSVIRNSIYATAICDIGTSLLYSETIQPQLLLQTIRGVNKVLGKRDMMRVGLTNTILPLLTGHCSASMYGNLAKMTPSI